MERRWIFRGLKISFAAFGEAAFPFPPAAFLVLLFSMHRSLPPLALLLCSLLSFPIPLPAAEETYPVSPDSIRQPNVPKGTVTKYTFTSQIFPGTTRDYWLYV